MLRITRAESDSQFRQLRGLFAELGAWDTSQVERLGLNGQKALDFYYSSDDEDLPGRFAPPSGGVYLAAYSEHPAGCAAFHAMTQDICEMKRMYVRPQFRGQKVGRCLLQTLLKGAMDAGYSVMRLETVTFMERAIAMYSSFGFRTCAPYYEIPEVYRPITVFMELNLIGAA